MAWKGTGSPVIVSADMGVTVFFPRPLKGKRKETYKDEKKVYTNVDGHKLVMESKFRFIGEYEFGELSPTQLNGALSIYNNQSTCKWVCHADMIYMSYLVQIVEMSPSYLQGHINYDTVKIKVESVGFIYKIPTIDNMIKGYKTNRVGVV